MADDLWQRSACELAEGIAQRKFSCRDVMASVAGRIRARNGALNAIVYDYTEEAMAEAGRADEELAAGRVRGPLHGVPVTIKENVDQQGKPTPNGLPAFEKVIAPDDAPVVRNLKAAGAIVVGRTNTPELSMRATTDNPLHCRTRGIRTPRRADRPVGPVHRPRLASARFTTATTSAARCGSRPSPAAWPR
jgi:amidase